jgi:hypothetical protein
VKICKVDMDQNVADALMKLLPQPEHEAHIRSMGIRLDTYMSDLNVSQRLVS